MSVAQTQPIDRNTIGAASSVSKLWIINCWADQAFIILTPLLAIPLFYLLNSPWVGINADTIGLIVTAFFAAGHHFPGMVRAYGDRELFRRFRWRFILVPPIVFSIFFPLYIYHQNAFRLITLFWATWHGLMQVYGFGRIYDLKTGDKSLATANWDWLLCFSWFVTAQVVSPDRMYTLLDLFYSLGSPEFSPKSVQTFQWGCIAFSSAILIGFFLNSVIQSARGTRLNPNKFLVLVSGIGLWWVAFVQIESPLLGLAVSDFSHDVQYMAIVWLYNCRRVNANANVGKLMKFVFRRGMVPIYLGFVFSYGAIGLVPGLSHDESVKTLFMGILWTSTIMHYYMDGFIWKVRESSTQASLGLNNTTTSAAFQLHVSGVMHLLKWSPLFLFVGWLFVTDLDHSSVAAARAKELRERYIDNFLTSNSLPANQDEQSWLYARFREVQNIAAAVPGSRTAQKSAATMLTNFGQFDEATEILERWLTHRPDDADGLLTLGVIQIKRGKLDLALSCFENALKQARDTDERTRANLAMGEVFLMRNEPDMAKAKFDEALKVNPALQSRIHELRNGLRTGD